MTWLTLEQAAERLHTTHWSLRRAIQRGDLPAYKPLPGKGMLIREEDLEQFVLSRPVAASRPTVLRVELGNGTSVKRDDFPIFRPGRRVQAD